MLRILVMLGVVYLLYGCVKQIDILSTFNVVGSLSCETDCSVAEAKLYLVDSGMDYARSKQGFIFHEKQLSVDENVNYSLEYFWGYEDGFLKGTSRGFFDAVIECSGCKTIREKVYLDGLVKENGSYVLNISDFRLSCD